MLSATPWLLIVFQSTLLMRGATRRQSTGTDEADNFNPRSSCEERRPLVPHNRLNIPISIHAPHARSDVYLLAEFLFQFAFQSTLLMRGATL